MTPRPISVRRIDDDGLTLFATADRPLDVVIEGRRVWTFWSIRDTEAARRPAGALPWPWRRVAWPRPLTRHLQGRAHVVVRGSAAGEVHLDREVAFGSGEGRVRVVNRAGVELGIDKSGKLVPTFSGRSDGDIGALLDATEAAIGALREAGLEPFLAYGTLLGAVREGRVLGHDSDADLGYVSRHRDPVDVCRESFAVQRRLSAAGWSITRYSGAGFKISVTEADVTRGLDVFGGFLDEGRLYLMGEIGTPFRPEWVHPLGTVSLHGRPMPVPAAPERLLEATYGPGWRVPDPAFQFTTPARTHRALDDWFRGTQPNIRHWERRASTATALPARAPSALARRAAALAARQGAEVLDVGAGRGVDSLWLARRGLPVTAYDYVPRGLAAAGEAAAREGLSLQTRALNLTDGRSVLAEGARLAHSPRPRVVLARHVLDATSAPGRAAFARLCSMALREGGWALVEVDVADDDPRPEWKVGQADPEAIRMLLSEAGAKRVDVRRLPNRTTTVRVVGRW